MDAGNAAELALVEYVARPDVDGSEHCFEKREAERTGFHEGDAGQVVLRPPVLLLHQVSYVGGGSLHGEVAGLVGNGRVGNLVPPEHGISG